MSSLIILELLILIACDVAVNDLRNGLSIHGRGILCHWVVLKGIVVHPVCREPRGIAFVEYTNARDAEDAKHALDRKEILGREVWVTQKESSCE